MRASNMEEACRRGKLRMNAGRSLNGPFEHVVILTGAGISAESGLSTFRDEGGIWSQYAIEEVATPAAFRRNPDLVHEFYNLRRRAARDAGPNAAHLALARLEREHAGRVTVVTQNVDDLHERAGSRNVLHMHGELFKLRCTACGEVWAEDGDAFPHSACIACAAVGTVRPHIVWFGEVPHGLDEIFALLERCDLFLSIGTSGHVYPAAGFVTEVRRHGRAHTVELNLEPSLGESLFAERIYGRAGEIVPRFVERLLAGVVQNSLESGRAS